MKLGIISCAIALCIGCSHNVASPKMAETGGGPPEGGAPPDTGGIAADAHGYPALPPVVATQVPPMVEVQPPMHDHPMTETPCGHSLTVKVGELDINMPQGGSLEIAGVKTATKQYHVVLKGVEFTNTDHCLQ